MAENFRVIALLAAYNEGDVISPVIEQLVENGVDVYLIDNRSTDNTVAEASRWLGRGLMEIEQFPERTGPGESAAFDWTALLRRKEELSQELAADWFLHHDADEFRESPWPGTPLKEAIRWVDRLGYNCIDFRVLNFPPTDDAFEAGQDPRLHFRYWEAPAAFDQGQVKCWKKEGSPISLIPSGGHEVGMPHRRIFPIQFLLRHYPIRGQGHGRRKIFSDRRGRFVDRERARQWHIQYDGIEESHDFLADPATLRPFDEDQVRLELMLDNAVTRHEKYLAGLARNEATRAAQETEAARVRGETLELEASRLDGQRAADEAARARLEQRAADLEELAGDRGRRIADLEKSVEASQGRIADLERALGQEEGRRRELEREIGFLESSRAPFWRTALRRLLVRTKRDQTGLKVKGARKA
jgi:glycosyltransferase involved in cell wall biosynthesis